MRPLGIPSGITWRHSGFVVVVFAQVRKQVLLSFLGLDGSAHLLLTDSYLPHAPLTDDLKDLIYICDGGVLPVPGQPLFNRGKVGHCLAARWEASWPVCSSRPFAAA